MSSDDPMESRNFDYVQAMLTWARDDMRQVYIRTTAAIGFAVLVINALTVERIIGLQKIDRFVFLGGVVGFAASALLSFVYVSRTHVNVRDAAIHLTDHDTDLAESDVVGVFAGWRKRVLYTSNGLFFASAGAMLYTVARVLNL